MVEQLGLKIKRRDGIAETYEVPVQKRKLARQPAAPSGTFKQEPVLGWAEYEDILKLLRSMSLVMELSPRAFAGIGEEHLRFHFLVVLNAVYEGQATGETFISPRGAVALLRGDLLPTLSRLKRLDLDVDFMLVAVRWERST